MPIFKYKTKSGRLLSSSPQQDDIEEHDNVSILEIDGLQYTVDNNILASGINVSARSIKALSTLESNDKSSYLVLTPLKPLLDAYSLEEAAAKIYFYKMMHDFDVPLLTNKDRSTYRLIVPFFNFPSLDSVSLQTPVEFWQCCFSIVMEMERCHAASLVNLDISLHNILYDKNNQKSYLIDGGHSVKIGQEVQRCIYGKSTPKKVAYARENHYFVAPEVFYDESVSHKPPLAEPSMDIYSLGKIMHLLVDPDSDKGLPPDTQQALVEGESVFMQLMIACTAQNPTDRPTLDSVKKLIKSELDQQADKIASDEQNRFFSNPRSLGSQSKNPSLKNKRCLIL